MLYVQYVYNKPDLIELFTYNPIQKKYFFMWSLQNDKWFVSDKSLPRASRHFWGRSRARSRTRSRTRLSDLVFEICAFVRDTLQNLLEGFSRLEILFSVSIARPIRRESFWFWSGDYFVSAVQNFESLLQMSKLKKKILLSFKKHPPTILCHLKIS